MNSHIELVRDGYEAGTIRLESETIIICSENKEKTVRILTWRVVKRVNTRSVSYAMKDVISACVKEECEVEEDLEASMLLVVRRVLTDNEDPKQVRSSVEQRLRIVHPRIVIRFEGLTDQ